MTGWLYHNCNRKRVSEIVEFLKKYDSNLTIIYHMWDEMYYLCDSYIIEYDTIFIKKEPRNNTDNPLTVGKMIELLSSIETNLEVSLYIEKRGTDREHYLHSGLEPDNIYFK